ncbi:MAG: excinuclease ABC subunit UvrC [Bacilli bacterium]|nr:excinuclease ABC subunit UvrC [Bacilli bacterium]
MTEAVKVAIPLLPRRPGCYLMKDKDNKVIYVGKAKNLFNRVSQYFLRPQVGKVAAMVSHVDHFETIITKTDKEAFILELNLIHQYYPRYNILLKDAKHYPYIALKKKNDPYLKIARNDKDKNYYYFGPFPTSSYAYSVIDLLNKLFPTRKCRNVPNEPCLYYHMGMCLAPCINKVSEQENDKLFNEIKTFLEGNNPGIAREIKEKMQIAAENLEFEKANDLKKTLDAIEHVLDKQGVENKDHVNRDVFAYTTRDGYLSLAILTYRNGLLLGKESYIVEEFGDNIEQISDLIFQYYESHSLPKEILMNIEGVSEILSPMLETKFVSVTKGKLIELIEMANLNAVQSLDSHFMSARLTDDNFALLDDLGNRLGIKTPYRIELFDNSHIQGDAPVGAMVAFINGEPVKKMYRKFNIEGKEKRDDYASMKEVMTRRYSRLKENGDEMPDLILTDGGLGQIHAGCEVIDELGLSIPVFGLFKNDKHQTKGLMDKDGNVISLEDNKPLFFLLVRMQDEVHRFAIGFHHQKRGKNFTKSILDDIEGLGDKRKQIVLDHYTDIDMLKKATVEELSQYLPKDVAERIVKKISEN